jgi:hypothetical protein
MKETAERRRLRRLACMLTVHYRVAERWHPGAVLDLSPTGCRLRIGEDLKNRAPVQLRFEAPLRDGSRAASLDVAAVVMWCRQDGLSRRAGMRFTDSPVGLDEILAAIGEA